MVFLALRDRPARWLAIPALVLALPAGVVAAADVDLDGGIGQREYTPAAPAELRPGGYELGTGELVVDLRRMAWPAGDEPVRLKVDVGIGHALVLVPADVCVQADARAGAGYVGVLGEESAGADVDDQRGAVTRYDGPKLILDAQVGMGAIEVRHRRVGREDWDDERGERISEALATAGCAGSTS